MAGMRRSARVVLLLFALAASGLAGCTQPEEEHRDLGCGGRHDLMLREGEPPTGGVAILANYSVEAALGYLETFLVLGDFAAKDPANPQASVEVGGYRVVRYDDGATTVQLTGLEWLGLLGLLDAQAVEQGAISAGPFDPDHQYVMYADTGQHRLELVFTSMVC